MNEEDKRVLAAILIGEAGTDKGVAGYDANQGMQAVLNTMINQAKHTYKTDNPSAKQILTKATKPNNYSAYNNVTDKTKVGWANKIMVNYSGNYKDVTNLIDEYLSGNLKDIVGGATHYYNPKYIGTSAMPTLKEEHLFESPKKYNFSSHVFGFDPKGFKGKFTKGENVFEFGTAYSRAAAAIPDGGFNFMWNGKPYAVPKKITKGMTGP